MEIVRKTEIYHADTGETEIVEKTLELVLSPEPPAQEGYCAEEWWEETATQYIQHWNIVAVDMSAEAEDYEAALERLGVEL